MFCEHRRLERPGPGPPAGQGRSTGAEELNAATELFRVSGGWLWWATTWGEDLKEIDGPMDLTSLVVSQYIH